VTTSRPGDVQRAYRRAHGIRSTAALTAFEQLLALPQRNVEYSAKIEGSRVHHRRMAVIFDSAIAERLHAIRERLDRIARLPGATLDLTHFDLVMRDLALDRVTLCAFGLDARDRLEDSRIKVWWSILDQPRKVRELLAAHGGDDSVRRLVRESVLLAGTDLTLSGTTRLKLYPKYTPADLEDPAVCRVLQETLSPVAMAWIARARRTNVSFEPDGGRTLHFQPFDPEAMLAAIGNPRLPGVDAGFRTLGLRLNVLSLREDDLDRTPPEHLNVYYVA
jgi:LynF/TruF/PatF family peptide O-prenyltransferase